MTPELFQAMRTDPIVFFRELVIPSAFGPMRYSNVMADFQRRRFEAIAPSLLASIRGERPQPAKFWWEGVKGLGKSSDAAYVGLYALAFTRVPQLIQLAASDADQAAEPKRAAEDALRLNAWLPERISIQANKIICAATNSVAEVLAADIAGSHGARPTMLILDEVAHVQKFDFTSNLLDNATKIPHCLTLALTNAGFTNSPAWKLRELARTSSRWTFDAVTEPPAWIDPAEIAEAAERNTPERFARLWQGVWSNQSGDALSSADIQACIVADGPMSGKELACDNREWLFVAGLDLGIRHDHSAICVLAIHRQTRRRRLAFVKSWSPKKSGGKVKLDTVKSDVAKIHESYGLRTLFFDPYQAILLAEQLQKDGLRMQEVAFVGANLNEMAAEVLESFNSRSIELYRCKELIEDLGRLTIVERSFGYKLESARDASGHADTATAFSLALLAAKRTPINRGWDCAVYTNKSADEATGDGVEKKPYESLTGLVNRAQNRTYVPGGQRPLYVDTSRPENQKNNSLGKSTPGWSM